jgi:hypothetical protein
MRSAAILPTNCAGAAGVGPKRAAQLVRRYGAVDGVLDAGLFRTQAETLRLYRRIATMDALAPLPSLADQAPSRASASTLAQLGAETVGGSLGGKGVTSWGGVSRRAGSRVRQWSANDSSARGPTTIYRCPLLLLQLFAAFSHIIQKGAGLAIEKLNVLGLEPAG